MSEAESVTLFRVDRVRRAPRNWTYWVAAFTLLNGVFLLIGQVILILAGLVAPFVVPAAWPHLVAAAVFAALAYFSAQSRALLIVALAIYVADALLAAYLALWAGLVMHIIVLSFVGMALAGAHQLARQLTPATRGSAD